ncbi:MAG: hypothetical protein VYD18_12915, partial [Candidatus Latescibacterota bacterium]|nr:hypothetical protein [Candidatus Latescibacterota bacterium]
MSFRRNIYSAMLVVFATVLGSQVLAQPVYENNSPTGFSVSDSTSTVSFVVGDEVTVQVDLNEAANFDFPVVGNFQKLESSNAFFSTPGVASYMDQALEVDGNGIIHRAWIQQRGVVDPTVPTSTPVYGVVYAKSLNGGKTFLDTVSVSGSMRFDLITPNMSMTSGFSTLDLVIDSKGNPRVVYAMNSSPDGLYPTGSSRILGRNRQSHNNIFFNYSNDGGSSWLPANNAVVVNDTNDVSANGVVPLYPGRNSAFPRMDISQTDDIYIVYERSVHGTVLGAGGVRATQSATHTSILTNRPDIMLAKMDADSLKLGSAQPVRIGASGTVGSTGGIRISPDNLHSLTPDIAIGDDDILHVVWYSPIDDRIEHKQMPADNWADNSTFGWSPGAVGAAVGIFDDDVSNFGLANQVVVLPDNHLLLNRGHLVHLFPTVVVDKSRSPDRVYVFWKHTDGATAVTRNDENISYNISNYNGQSGAGAAWASAGGVPAPSFVFPIGGGAGQTVGPLFQGGSAYTIESHWAYVDRIAVVVDPRKNNGADLHIAFSGGNSVSQLNFQLNEESGVPSKNTSIYYSRFNGSEWELPQVVASQRNGSPDGFPASTYVGNALTSRAHSAAFAPRLAMRSGDDNVYMSFVGGSPSNGGSSNIRGTRLIVDATAGRGYSTIGPANIAPLPYFKILGRVVTFDDVSIPTGANLYRMNYTPVFPQTIRGGNAALTKNMISVLAADNTDGSGIGWTQPGTSTAPGGFLTGQWMRITPNSMGVTSLVPGTANATFKGAISKTQAENNNGVWEGLANEDVSAGLGEWGDNGDKANLLVKLNVLGSDSPTNLYVISASSSAKLEVGSGANRADRHSQSVSLIGVTAALMSPTIVQGQTAGDIAGNNGGFQPVGDVSAAAGTFGTSFPPLGSYFLMGANISIVAENKSPIVSIVSPDATTATTSFANSTFLIRYVLFDEDDDIGTTAAAVAPDTLKMELYFYPDSGLSSVRDIRTFATLIVDENDAFTTAATNPGTGDFIETSAAAQDYSWDDPGVTLQTAYGWAPITKALDGHFSIYVVADDGSNPPVFAVSAGPVRIRHIPLANSVSPVAVDTVDTGEYDDLDKTNPYLVKFGIIDYNDNAQVRLFFSTEASLGVADVTITGTLPDLTLDLAGATPIQMSDTLRTDEDTHFSFDVTAQGSALDSIIAQGNYTIYAVVADGDSFAVGKSAFPLAVRHSPSFEFTAPLPGTVKKINSTQQFAYTIEWQRGRSDDDKDGNARITLYYTGVDPNTFNYSGTDSTRLIATTGTNPGNATLIQGGIREDDEGAGDQFVWDFKNPQNALPKTFRQNHTSGVAGHYNVHQYQAGASTDTAWVYAVLADSLGNTRVAAGGAILLLGSQETPASQTPRVIMRTPPAGDQLLVNGDVVKLEWDAFLIDDNTGTEDAYLRLYAAPKGVYKDLTGLQSNVTGTGGANNVIVINSLTGSDKKKPGSSASYVTELRESGPNFFNWDTKTTSFGITGTPTEFDIFVAGSMDPFVSHGAAPVYVNGQVDSVASGLGTLAMKAVLSKAPGVLRVEGMDPLFSIELAPGSFTASTGDTLDLQVLSNSQGSSIDQMNFFLNVPRSYFDIVDQDPGTAGMQPFADSTGAFQTPSTVAQNDTSAGTAQFIKLKFVESIILGEVVGRVSSPYDSSQTAATLQL